jgi:carbon-monoxide dehydrogenase large subunit
VFTNKVPVDAFRGAGRPEATYVPERLIHHAAAVLDIDPAELRARNLLETRTEDLTTVTGLVVAGGRFLDNQRRCLEIADRRGFTARREASARRGLLRGFGFANYLEANGGLQVADAVKAGTLPVERAALTFGTDGTLDVVVGTQSSGQDHARPIALQAARGLGLDPDAVTVREGDSSALSPGAVPAGRNRCSPPRSRSSRPSRTPSPGGGRRRPRSGGSTPPTSPSATVASPHPAWRRRCG